MTDRPGRYASWSEWTDSATAKARGLPNEPDATARANIRAYMLHLFDQLREAWGAPINITSGFRHPNVNRAVGGSRTSQHTTGEAADLVPTPGPHGSTPVDLLQLLVSLDLDFDQAIVERVDLDASGKWLHLSRSNGGTNRRSKLWFNGNTYGSMVLR